MLTVICSSAQGVLQLLLGQEAGPSCSDRHKWEPRSLLQMSALCLPPASLGKRAARLLQASMWLCGLAEAGLVSDPWVECGCFRDQVGCQLKMSDYNGDVFMMCVFYISRWINLGFLKK